MRFPYSENEIKTAIAIIIDGVTFYDEKDTAMARAVNGSIGRFWVASVFVGETERKFIAFKFQIDKPAPVRSSSEIEWRTCDPMMIKAVLFANCEYAHTTDVTKICGPDGWTDSLAEQESRYK